MFLQPVPALLSLQTTLPVAVDSDVHLTWENPDEVDKFISHLQQIVGRPSDWHNCHLHHYYVYILEQVVGLMGVNLIWQQAK